MSPDQHKALSGQTGGSLWIDWLNRALPSAAALALDHATSPEGLAEICGD